MPEGHQLRVRLDSQLRAKLLKIAISRGRRETLSDMVREAIELFLDPDSCPESAQPSIVLGQDSQVKVQDMACKLDRKPGQVVEDCIQGIVDMLETQRTPLIVLEIGLRQKYFDRRQSLSQEGSHRSTSNLPVESSYPVP
jgi:predicted transcriptional regulator